MLDVRCQEPARAVVKLASDDSASRSGIEICELTPSTPGKYRIDIFWGGELIRDNPFYMNFPQRCIGDSTLNLEQETFMSVSLCS